MFDIIIKLSRDKLLVTCQGPGDQTAKLKSKLPNLQVMNHSPTVIKIQDDSLAKENTLYKIQNDHQLLGFFFGDTIIKLSRDKLLVTGQGR